MEETPRKKRPPWWFATAVWTAVAAASGLLALVIGSTMD